MVTSCLVREEQLAQHRNRGKQQENLYGAHINLKLKFGTFDYTLSFKVVNRRGIGPG
jgi:hypothetical protein